MSYKERTLKFHEIYRTKLVPVFEAYESERKLEFVKFVFWNIVGVLGLLSPIIMMFLAGYICTTGLSIMYFVAMILAPLLGVVAFYLNNGRGKKFGMKLKLACLPHVLKVFGHIKWRNGNKLISDDKLNESGLFGVYNQRRIDDEFVGEFKGVPFKICETEMWQESGSGKNKTCVPVFKGVVISFKSNKTIKNRTMVATKGDLIRKNSYWIGIPPLIVFVIKAILGQYNIFITLVAVAVFAVVMYAINRIDEGESLDSVTLEDPLFCKKFNAYSSDQVEARYLLTTAFIERFQNLNTAFGTKRAKCSFFGDEIMFAISTNKNLFELGSLCKSLCDPTSINAFYDELSSIYDMVTYFKLDEKIGL